MENIKIISYCCGKFPDSFGGVARFDYHLSLVFPNRIFFKGPSQKNDLLKYLQNNKEAIVITDNHLSCDIPNDIFTIIVHHGCAPMHAKRNPEFLSRKGMDELVKGQINMLSHRKLDKTIFLSCSENCIDMFSELFKEEYTKFKHDLLLHSSEITPQKKNKFNNKPVVICNSGTITKGKDILPQLKNILKNEFDFIELKTSDTKDINKHNKEITDIYKKADIFLQLSMHEGNSYSTLDGFVHDLLICGTNVGLLYDLKKNNNGDIGVIFDFEKIKDVNFVANQLRYLWKNKELYNHKSYDWFINNCDFKEWKKKIYNIVELCIKNKKI